jgi:hypothetical protein
VRPILCDSRVECRKRYWASETVAASRVATVRCSQKAVWSLETARSWYRWRGTGDGPAVAGTQFLEQLPQQYPRLLSLLPFCSKSSPLRRCLVFVSANLGWLALRAVVARTEARHGRSRWGRLVGLLVGREGRTIAVSHALSAQVVAPPGQRGGPAKTTAVSVARRSSTVQSYHRRVSPSVWASAHLLISSQLGPVYQWATASVPNSTIHCQAYLPGHRPW